MYVACTCMPVCVCARIYVCACVCVCMGVCVHACVYRTWIQNKLLGTCQLYVLLPLCMYKRCMYIANFILA